MKPHLYLLRGRWFVCRHGRRKRNANVDAPRPTFPEACHLAMLAAIHAGVWRA